MKDKIVALTSRVARHELVSGSTYLFMGTMLANIFAFIFNLFLVRHLSFVNYAEINSLLSLIILTSIPSQAFLPTIVQFATKYLAKNERVHASELFWQASLKIGAIALSLFVGFIVFSPLIGSFLHVHSFGEIILAGAVVAIIYLSVTNTAFLQSMLKFRFLGFTLSLGGVLKLFVGVGAITFGFGLYGILWGFFLTFFIPFLLSFFPLQFLIIKRVKTAIHSKEIFAYGLPAAIAIFSLTSFTSTDIILAKHFFTSSDAALYSGLSLLGKIIFYFSAPIASVMFPLVIKRIHNKTDARGLLYASFLMVLLPSLVLTIFYFSFPNLIISLVLGQHYVIASPLLGWFGLYIGIFSLLNITVNFLLSIGETNISWVVLGGAILQIIGISLFHGSISVVIGLSLVLSLVLFVLLLLYYLKFYAQKISN